MLVRGGLCGLAWLLVSSPGSVRAETLTYTYTGGEQAFGVPPNVTSVHVVAVGGRGGKGAGASNPQALGGPGVTATADLPVTAGQILYVEVGGNGTDGAVGPANGNPAPGGAASFNGGGQGGQGGAGGDGAGSGGGASDVRTSPRAVPLTQQDSRLIIAGGGAGNGGGSEGGAGGGGANATAGSAPIGVNDANPGQGGTTNMGGSAGGWGACSECVGNSGAIGTGGTGGDGVPCSTRIAGPCHGGGGGGGGLYGGGGGGSAFSGGGGGGGGSSGFAPSATNRSLADDFTGTPSVTITYTPSPGGGGSGGGGGGGGGGTAGGGGGGGNTGGGPGGPTQHHKKHHHKKHHHKKHHHKKHH